VSAFLAWNLVAIVAATLPGTPSPLRGRLIAATRPYLRFTGLWQGWDMFAPYPQSFTADAQAVVSHADGRQSTWRIPGPEQVRSGKYGADRWRKWRDAVRSDASWTIWADTARLAARLKADPANPPVRVELVRRWGDVPPPRPGDLQPRQFPEPINEATYFRYDVRAPDLAR
jgi:hypothetical protein